MMPSKRYRSSSCARRYAFSDFSRRCSSADSSDVQQLVDLKRLADEVPGAALDGFDRVLHRAVAGDDDRDDVRIALDRRFDDGRTVDAGQPQVGDDDVEGEIGEPRERRLARFGLLDLIAVVGQLFGDRLAQRRLVFDQQQMFRSIRHLRGANILTHHGIGTRRVQSEPTSSNP